MNLAYVLGKDISAQKILHDIQKQINKINKDDLSSTLLVISLVKVSNNETTPLIENKG